MNDTKIKVQNLNFFYGAFHALKDVSMDFKANEVTALIGPSGCGKSTFLRCLNRMNDLISGIKAEGNVFLDDLDVYDPHLDVVSLRRQIGMVFQKPNPFPKSIFENVAYGLRVNGIKKKSFINERVKKALKALRYGVK